MPKESGGLSGCFQNGNIQTAMMILPHDLLCRLSEEAARYGRLNGLFCGKIFMSIAKLFKEVIIQ